MGKIRFGGRQLKNPTPASFERFAKIFIGLSGLVMAWMPTNNLVPHHIQDVITPINNLANSVMIFLLPFFGVKVEENSVPKEDVTSMETKHEQ
jgi:hypothetical protein